MMGVLLDPACTGPDEWISLASDDETAYSPMVGPFDTLPGDGEPVRPATAEGAAYLLPLNDELAAQIAPEYLVRR